jgi:hypothetical protein
MLVGAPPFYSENKKEMIKKILTVNMISYNFIATDPIPKLYEP